MAETKGIKKKLLNEKPADTLVYLAGGASYPRELSQVIDTPYAHMVRTLTDLKEKGLVKNTSQGRKKVYKLTPKGRKLSEKLQGLEDAPGVEFNYPEQGKQETQTREKRPQLGNSIQKKYG